MVSLQSDPAVVLHFQDYDYQDIRSEVGPKRARRVPGRDKR